MSPEKHPLTAFSTVCAMVMKTKIVGCAGQICQRMLMAAREIEVALDCRPNDITNEYANAARKLLQLEFGPGEGRHVADLIMEASETIDMILATRMIELGEHFIPAETANDLKHAFQQSAPDLAVSDDVVINTLAVLDDRVQKGYSAKDIQNQAGGEMNGQPVAVEPSTETATNDDGVPEIDPAVIATNPAPAETSTGEQLGAD